MNNTVNMSKNSKIHHQEWGVNRQNLKFNHENGGSKEQSRGIFAENLRIGGFNHWKRKQWVLCLICNSSSCGQLGN